MLAFLAFLSSLPIEPDISACSLASSEAVTFAELDRRPDRWFDRCVRVKGTIVGRVFYADESGFYLRFANDRDDRPLNGRIGVYAVAPAKLPDNHHAAEVTGVFSRCGRSIEANAGLEPADAIVMLVGFCHYEDGHILLGAKVRLGKRVRFERQMGETKRMAFGDLEIADQSEIPDVVDRLIGQFEAAYAKRDLPALKKFVEPYDFTLNSPADEAAFDTLLLGDKSPFADLSLARSNRQIFRIREEEKSDYSPGWVACYCKDGSCAGRWPISSLDATIQPDRPYACIEVYRDVTAERKWGVGLRKRESLAEPFGGVAER